MRQEIDFRELILQEIQKGKLRMPVLNPIALKIRQLVANEADIQEIVQTIKLDSTLCASVLEAVNSAYYGLEIKRKTIEDAISFLGIKATGEVVVTATLSRSFVTTDTQLQPVMALLWKHNLCCALAAQWVASRYAKRVVAEAFIGGILHDFGKLRVLSAIERIKVTRKHALPPLSSSVILEAMDALHTTQGFHLLKEMNLPEEYCLVARDHHMASERVPAANTLLMVVRYADCVCGTLGVTLNTNPTDLTNEARRIGEQMAISEADATELIAYLGKRMRLPSVAS